MINFDNVKFTTEYSFASSRNIIRDLSDAFSKTHCDVKEAPKYAAKFTEGRCLFCGKPLYSLAGPTVVFSNMLHYDHIYPASKLNLFEVGNVGLACQTCNLAKNSRLPLEYYDVRVAEGGSLLIDDRDEFIKFLDKMTAPYREKWPDHFAVNFADLDDAQFKERLTTLLFDYVDIAASGSRYNHTHSVNWPIWEKVTAKAYELYTPLTAKDVVGRLGYANEIFENEFGVGKSIQNCTIDELSNYTTILLLSKYEFKNEVQKFRMLVKVLTEVLIQEMTGLESFYETVPTYSQIKVDETGGV